MTQPIYWTKILFFVLVLVNLSRQIEAQTLIDPSQPQPTRDDAATNQTARRAGDTLNKALGWGADKIIEFQFEQRINANQAKIQEVMPVQGGVLIVAYVLSEKQVGIYQARRRELLPGIQIVFSKDGMKDAMRRADEKTIGPADTTSPLRDSPRGSPDFFETIRMYRWISAPAQDQAPANPINLLQPLGESIHRFEEFHNGLESQVQMERQRLLTEWIGLENQDTRLVNLQSELHAKQVENPSGNQEDMIAEAAVAQQREEKRREANLSNLRRTIVGKRAALEAEGRSIEVEARALSQRRTSLDNYMRNWRCPAGLTFDRCKDHRETCNKFQSECTSIGRDIARLGGILEERRRSLSANQLSLSVDSTEIPKLANAGRSESMVKAEVMMDRSKAISDDQERVAYGREEYLKRLREFREDSARLKNAQEMLMVGKKLIAEAKLNNYKRSP